MTKKIKERVVEHLDLRIKVWEDSEAPHAWAIAEELRNTKIEITKIITDEFTKNNSDGMQ